MTKWADYCIYDVMQDDKGSIKEVKYKIDKGGESFSGSGTFTKNEVIIKIENGETFITIYKKDGSNKFSKGKNVKIIKGSNSEKYIRTDANEKLEDNLEFKSI